MKNACTRLLIVFLGLVSVVTLINVIILYRYPSFVPFSSFIVRRLMFLAFIEKAYWLILLSVLICALVFLTAVSVHRRHILLPILSLIFLVYEFITAFSLLIDGMHYPYWCEYAIVIATAGILILLLCVYCLDYFRKRCEQKNKACRKCQSAAGPSL